MGAKYPKKIMKFTSLRLPEIMIIEPKIFMDDRGIFYETYNETIFKENVSNFFTYFVQDNYSQSNAGTIRGLHYQEKPYDQGKIISVNSGKIFDVAVDIRRNSKTYGQYVSEILSSSNKKQIWIPSGFAHGFMALEDDTRFTYAVDNYWDRDSERCLKWDDKTVGIEWPELDCYSVSDKDKVACSFKDLKTSFKY